MDLLVPFTLEDVHVIGFGRLEEVRSLLPKILWKNSALLEELAYLLSLLWRRGYVVLIKGCCQVLDSLCFGLGPEVLLVEPGGFLDIKLNSCFVDSFYREGLDKLLAAEKLFPASCRAPAKQR